MTLAVAALPIAIAWRALATRDIIATQELTHETSTSGLGARAGVDLIRLDITGTLFHGFLEQRSME